MSSSITKVSARIIILNSTEKSISSFSLCSIHCFQILNCSEAYLPLLLSPKLIMLEISLSLILLRSLVSIRKKHWNVWLKLSALESTEYLPSYTKFRTSTMTGCLRRPSIFISSMISRESFLSVICIIGSLINLYSWEMCCCLKRYDSSDFWR